MENENLKIEQAANSDLGAVISCKICGL